jgi:metal-dependent amidase/aminoacylase/carboxypeptidase family protein
MLCALVILSASATAQTAEIDAIYPDIEALYIDLHQNPELAFQETQTSAKLVS